MRVVENDIALGDPYQDEAIPGLWHVYFTVTFENMVNLPGHDVTEQITLLVDYYPAETMAQFEARRAARYRAQAVAWGGIIPANGVWLVAYKAY